MSNNAKILLSLISIAFVVRVLVIWIGRPEFVGWFNHTYYYYIETKGLLQNGQLPFPDMPLLFYIYAGTAKILMLFGIEMHPAIVASTRFWMSLFPALLPLPVFLTIKDILKGKALPKWVWIFLFACAFYPLSILQMPEFLQKNMLGLLLFSFFIWQSKLALNQLDPKRLGILSVLFLLIVFTHFGTAAITILYVIAILLAFFMGKSKKVDLKLLLVVLSGLGITLVLFYFIDIQRFNRIGYYINRIYDSSSLGLLFSSHDPDKFTTVFMLIVPLVIAVFLFKWYRSVRVQLSDDNDLFWLSSIIFCYMLVLPIYEPLLMARFANYLVLPVVFIVIYMIRYSVKYTWLKNLILGIVIIGTLTIAFGDIISSFWHNRNKEVIYADLMKMNDTMSFTENDLIITRNGAEHISNWFLNTKSCLITSFNLNDLNKYKRVFILNPREGSMRLSTNTNEAGQWYNYMLSNIEVPSNAIETYISEHIELFKIEARPEEWVFDDNGDWKSYE